MENEIILVDQEADMPYSPQFHVFPNGVPVINDDLILHGVLPQMLEDFQEPWAAPHPQLPNGIEEPPPYVMDIEENAGVVPENNIQIGAEQFDAIIPQPNVPMQLEPDEVNLPPQIDRSHRLSNKQGFRHLNG